MNRYAGRWQYGREWGTEKVLSRSEDNAREIIRNRLVLRFGREPDSLNVYLDGRL